MAGCCERLGSTGSAPVDSPVTSGICKLIAASDDVAPAALEYVSHLVLREIPQWLGKTRGPLAGDRSK